MPPKEKAKAAAKQAAPKKGKGDGKGKKGKGASPEEEAEEGDGDGKNPDDDLPPPPPDSEEEDEDKVVPSTGKLFMIPRDANHIVEIEVKEGGDEPKVKNIHRDMGDWTNGKYVHCARARNSMFYCVPYEMGKVMELDPITSRCRDIGDALDSKGGHHKYTTAVVCSNWHGKMYAAPCRAKRILEIDPDKGTAEEIGKDWEPKPRRGQEGVVTSKYYAIACSPQGIGTGKIYAIPYDARRVLEIDPTNGGRAKEIGPDLGSMPAKYKCVALGPIGDLYAAPLNANKVLRITRTGEVEVVGPDFGMAERKFACILQGPNKLIYAPPLYADRVIEINPNKGETREIGPVIGVGEAKYCCACVGINDNIYCPPLEARAVLEINCFDHEVNEFGMDIGTGMEKFSSIAAAPLGGKLYAAPREARKVLEIDPMKQIVREVGQDLGSCMRKYTTITTGLSHKEIVDAGKNAVYTASKGLERGIRFQKQSQLNFDKAEYQFSEAGRKLEKAGPMLAEADAEEKAMAAEFAEAEKFKTDGAAEAGVWIRAREAAKEAEQKARAAKDRLARFMEDFDRLAGDVARDKGRLEERVATVAQCQQALDKATKEEKEAREKEVEARRQKAEVEDDRKAKEKQYG